MLGVVAAIIADCNYRILQLAVVPWISYKEEVAKDFCLGMLDSFIEWL